MPAAVGIAWTMFAIMATVSLKKKEKNSLARSKSIRKKNNQIKLTSFLCYRRCPYLVLDLQNILQVKENPNFPRRSSRCLRLL